MIEIAIEKELQSAQGPIQLQADIRLAAGETMAIYGDSGVGKTSLLRMVAGLMKPDKGHIRAEDTTWYDHVKKINRTPEKRKVGFVFQDYALFPNMTLRENIAFACPKSSRQLMVDDLIDVLELRGVSHLKPAYLSGGQKQRTAIGRALAQQSQLLLLDEPLSALDDRTRYELQNYLITIRRKFNVTMILVSHSIPEILRLADQVIMLDQGTVIRQGRPAEVFMTENVSGKFQFYGDVVQVEAEQFLLILHVRVGKDIIKVVTDQQEPFRIGDKVMVASKAFNPIVKKIG